MFFLPSPNNHNSTVPHAGDLIALGSKPSSSKSLRHTPTDSDDAIKSSKVPNPGGNPSKKFKAAVASNDSPGGLFSDPIRVSQVSQQAAAAAAAAVAGGKQAPSKGGSHSVSPQPSTIAAPLQIIEGMCWAVCVGQSQVWTVGQGQLLLSQQVVGSLKLWRFLFIP